jgi:quinol-cytochrome oxidoreductase complex cytochrome b subunit
MSTKEELKKLTWTWLPESTREAGDSIVRNFLLHWFPAKIHRRSLAWNYSFYLGTISALLFAILCVTGALLMFFYVPSVERAYGSIKDLENVIAFGWILRSVHRIAAHLMVAVVFLHMMRVFLTGAYRSAVAAGANRPMNWIIGVALLLLTMFLSFTGYLLPWDQLAYWAITVGTNIASAAPLVGKSIRFILLGGHEIGQNALIRFYVLHCFFLPTAVLLLFSWHVWRVRKDGGLAVVDYEAQKLRVQKAPLNHKKTYSLLGLVNGRTVHVENALIDTEANEVYSSPHLTRRLAVISIATIVVTILLAMVFRAPLEEPANPSVTPNPAKAPWYFLWLQEIVTDTTIRIGALTINGALVGGILLPGLLVILAIAWPYLDKSPLSVIGVWLAKERRRQNVVFLIIVALILAFTIVGTFLRGPFWEFYWPWEAWPEAPVKF